MAILQKLPSLQEKSWSGVSSVCRLSAKRSPRGASSPLIFDSGCGAADRCSCRNSSARGRRRCTCRPAVCQRLADKSQALTLPGKRCWCPCGPSRGTRTRQLARGSPPPSGSPGSLPSETRHAQEASAFVSRQAFGLRAARETQQWGRCCGPH